MIAGVVMRRGRNAGTGAGPRRAVAATLAGAAIVAGPVATVPPANAGQVAVLVPPAEVNRLLDEVAQMRGGVLWADPAGALWVFSLDASAPVSRLYSHGALLVTRSPAVLGCLAFARQAR